jgi:hypothetical protein
MVSAVIARLDRAIRHSRAPLPKEFASKRICRLKLRLHAVQAGSARRGLRRLAGNGAAP